MLRLNVKATGFEEGRAETYEKFKRILQRSMFKMEEITIKKAPHDRGGLRQQISVTPEILADKYVLSSKAAQSEALEYGSRPFYAPIKPLIGWAKRKGGDEGMAYAVRAKIAKEGITAQPFMRPAFYEVKTFWLDQFAKDEFE